MGYYTTFRFIGKIKEEYVKDIEYIENQREAQEEEWNFWKRFAEKYPFAKKYSEDGRCTFIPFGVIEDHTLGEPSCNERLVTPSYWEWEPGCGCTWNFTCSLKDYNNTIETFLNDIANEICEEYIALAWGEDQMYPTVYHKEKEGKGQ